MPSSPTGSARAMHARTTALLAGLAVASCTPSPPLPRDVSLLAAQQPGIGAMMAHSVYRSALTVPAWTGGTSLSADVQWQIPEYHDEQKLTDPSGRTYGPLAEISAAPALGDLDTVAEFDQAGAAGVWVAVIDVLPGLPLTPQYAALHLGYGRHCVILSHDPASPPNAGWRGFVFLQTDVACTHPAPPPAATELKVIAIVDPAFPNASDLPAAARFGEAQNNIPIFGLRCAAAWCEFGPSNFQDRPPKHRTTPGNTLPPSRPANVKGWHDEQRLAVPRPGGGLEASTFYASVTPIANLEHTDHTNFQSFQQIATIWLSADPPPNSDYATKWHLRRGATVLEMRADATGTTWQARIRGDTLSRLLVHRADHGAGAIVPGTARWRWSDQDEYIWVRCSTGCCSVRAQ